MSHDRVLPDRGYCDPSRLPRGPNGRALCRWCRGEVPPGKRTFCGGTRAWVNTHDEVTRIGEGCIHEHCLRSNPGYARICVWIRDRGKCALCPARCGGLRGPWENDHVVPVAEGGGLCGLDGFRSLCRPCHRRVTGELRARLAAARQKARAKPDGR